jgi:malonate transporter and related proteins
LSLLTEFEQVFAVIIPALFVIVLGYLAGRLKEFDKDQVAGFSELILVIALPTNLFVGILGTSRTSLFQAASLFPALIVTMFGFYFVVFFIGRYALRLTIGQSALFGLAVCFPSTSFFGIPILTPLYGTTSPISISLSTLVGFIAVVPITLVFLGFSVVPSQKGPEQQTRHGDRAHNKSNQTESASSGSLLKQALLHSVKQPVVFIPVIAIVLVIAGLSLPKIAEHSLNLIGGITGGLALFTAGLSIATHSVSLKRDVLSGSFLKVLILPAFFWAVSSVLIVNQPFRNEGFVLMALPAAVTAVIFAAKYRTYEKETGSMLVLTSITLFVSLPVLLYLIGGT